MEKRKLGNTGLLLGVIGLGTVKFGRTESVKYPAPFTLPSDAELAALLDRARETGINYLDTAPAYGSSERRLGKLLEGRRGEWIIGTKAGETFTNGASLHDFSPGALRASVRQSLRDLKTDYLDLVSIHSDGRDEKIISEGALEVLAELKKEGWLRATGFSAKTARGAQRAAEHADAIMVEYRPDCRENGDVLDYCAQNAVGVLVKKALASGHAANAAENIKFALANKATTSVVIGTITPEHLVENIRAAAD